MKRLLTLILIGALCSGCCAKCPEYFQVKWPLTQQEQRIMALQEQVLRELPETATKIKIRDLIAEELDKRNKLLNK